MTMLDQKPYRKAVGVALFNPQGRVFLAERNDIPGAWQMPQGGIDATDESIELAARRELEEETGITSVKIIRQTENPIYYDYPDALTAHPHISKYRGQEQYWVAMLFTGQKDEIRLDAHDEIEFVNWEWADLPEAGHRIIDFKKDCYKQVIEAFQDIPALIPDLFYKNPMKS